MVFSRWGFAASASPVDLRRMEALDTVGSDALTIQHSGPRRFAA